jgi:hypothetical protein
MDGRPEYMTAEGERKVRPELMNIGYFNRTGSVVEPVL